MIEYHEVNVIIGSREIIIQRKGILPKPDYTTLDSAKRSDDMNAPNWKLHSLSGDLDRHYSVTANGTGD